MKYEIIYEKIINECSNLSNKIWNMQSADMSHKDWVQLTEMKQCIGRIRDILHKFQINIVAGGGSTV